MVVYAKCKRLLGCQYAIGIDSILFLFLFAARSARSSVAARAAIHGVLVMSSPVGTSHTCVFVKLAWFSAV